MKLTLVNKKTEVPGVESFVFIPTEAFAWKAGQYLHYVLHHRPTDDRGSDRWFTVASAPHQKEVMITTRIASEKGSSFKAELQKMQVGDAIEVSEIEGDFTVDDPATEYIFIAGGIGITPYHSILKEADHAGVKLNVTLLYANRDDSVPFKNELEEFAKNNPNLKIHYITSPERVDETLIRKIVPDLHKPHFYISGPAPMVFGLSETLTGMGIAPDHIKLDDFPGYPIE
jgi:ferredoxin-NADP reductase